MLEAYEAVVLEHEKVAQRPRQRRTSLCARPPSRPSRRDVVPRRATDRARAPSTLARRPARSRSNWRPPDARAIDRRPAAASVSLDPPGRDGDVTVMSVMTSVCPPQTNPRGSTLLVRIISARRDLSVPLQPNCSLSCVRTRY